MRKKGHKKRKVNKRFKILSLLILLLTPILVFILNQPIRNIYILNNDFLTDEDVIRIAGIKKYPNILSLNTLEIKNNLKKSIYIKDVHIKRKGLYNELYIDIKENYPLFYYQGKLYLSDFKIGDRDAIVPTIISDLDNNIFNSLKKSMLLIDRDILSHISEIKYVPGDVDKERFLFTMNDSIYAYITLSKIEKINDYLSIASSLKNKKGILYLDSGEYFEVKSE